MGAMYDDDDDGMRDEDVGWYVLGCDVAVLYAMCRCQDDGLAARWLVVRR